MTNNSCDYCYYCNYCNSCNCCNYCNYCNYCSSCSSCSSCISCSCCSSCSSCYYCYYCYYCKNLKMTEYNYFCWSKEYNDENSFQQKKYRVFNVEVTKEEYEKIDKIYHKLEFDKDEKSETRFQTAFKKMWDKLDVKGRQEYLDIPYFNWEGFTFITGVENESDSEVEKAVKLLIDKGILKDGKVLLR